MGKLFQKDEIWFAVVWIFVYVWGFGNADSLSEAVGIPKLITVFAGLLLTVILWIFIRKNKLARYWGLCKFQGSGKGFLWFLPLIALSTVNFWNGLTIQTPPLETALYILSMCFVGILEEVIFRGMLFRGMCRTNVKAAIVVSSLTFGAGHIINLLLGEPLLDTLLQLIYASAIGFCYTAVFYTGGSILPCIASHIFVNTTSVFAVEAAPAGQLLIAAIETVLGVSYGIWLLQKQKCPPHSTGGDNTMQAQTLKLAIDRIRQMEALFDKLQQSANGGESGLSQSDLQVLIDYYESPLWRYDYNLDEQGYLPAGLKRGVLSEDGIYNFLSQFSGNISDNLLTNPEKSL